MSEKKRITFNYHFDDNYNPEYVNGAYGGIGPKGELIVNFYLERQGIPKSHTHEVKEDGSLDSPKAENQEESELNLIRYINTGVILNLESAKRIHDWLGQKIDEFEKMVKSNFEDKIDYEGEKEK